MALVSACETTSVAFWLAMLVLPFLTAVYRPVLSGIRK